MAIRQSLFLVLFLVSSCLFAQVRGPHGGELKRVSPAGPHTELPGYYERLFFELVQGKNELILYPFLEEPHRTDKVPLRYLRKELPEFNVNIRNPANGTDKLLTTTIYKRALHAILDPATVKQLELKQEDRFSVYVAVIHEGMSKKVVFDRLKFRVSSP
jgi:hypothetical protein